MGIWLSRGAVARGGGYFSPRPVGERTGEGHRQNVFARGVGIEKNLAIQTGVERVVYSKGSVGVGFYWERFIDGGRPTDALRSAVSAPKTERPTPAVEVGLSGQFATFENCPLHKSGRTILLRGPNLSHNYWDVFHQNKRTVTGLQSMG